MQISVQKLFGVPSTSTVQTDKVKLEIPDKDHPMMRKPKWKRYKHRLELLSPVLDWMLEPLGDSLLLTGPSGGGKSSLPVDIAYRMKQPIISASAHARLTFQELIGHHTVVDGAMFYVHGPLATAMKHGYNFVLNEFDLMDEGELAGLNDLLEGNPLVIPENGGEIIEPHENFRFIATGNTNGSGDATGRYVGTGVMNMAFMDRFRAIEVPYMNEDDEAELIIEDLVDNYGQNKLGDDNIKKMVKTANNVRARFVAEGESSVDMTFSTRTLLRWANLTIRNEVKAKQGISPVRYALDIALLNKATPDTRAAINAIVDHVFGKAATGAASA